MKLLRVIKGDQKMRKGTDHWSNGLRRRLVMAMEKQKEYRDKFLRLAAEFENYKKIVEKEKASIRDSAIEKVVLDLAPILNNFNLALHSISGAEEGQDFDNLLKGVEMIYAQLVSVLESYGIKVIEAEGESFDPRFHEAIEVIETDEVEPGKVVRQYEPGYLLKNKLIKPARVAVAKPKQEKEDGKDGKESDRD